MSFIMRPIRFASTGFVIAGSALPEGSGDYLSRTFSKPRFSSRISTIDVVVKRVTLTTRQFLLYQQANGNTENAIILEFQADDTLKFNVFQVDSSTVRIARETTQAFRDVSAWMDIHIAFNTNLTTDASCKIHVNGTEITAFDVKTNPDTARDHGFLNSSKPLYWFGNAGGLSAYPYTARAFVQDGVFGVPGDVSETTDDGFYQINDASELFEATQTYFPTSARFDGSNDKLTLSSNLTSAADGKLAFYSFWVNLNGGDGSIMHIHSGTDAGGGNLYVIRHNTNRWNFYAHNVAVSAAAWELNSGTLHTAATGWTHVMMSVNGTEEHLYVNGVEDLKSGFTHVDTNAVGELTAWTVGGAPGGELLNGDLADFIYAQQYIDLSDAANRAKFITTDGFPVAWATSLAAVSSPKIAMHLDDGEAVANFANNADGTGQAFTVGGTLTDGADAIVYKNSFLLEGQSIAAGTDSSITSYSPGSVVFSGTPYITRGADLTGISDGNTGLISAWVKFGSDGSSEYLWGATTDNNEIQVYRRSDNTLWVNIQDTGNNGDLFLKTSETITVASGWTHLLISWDVSAGYSDIYINDSQSSLSLDTTTSGGLDYTHSNHNFFASDSGDSSEIFNGEAADFWLTVNQTRFELTTESNRRKFISSDGYAVDLGSDGSTPTGTAPLVFFHLDRGEAATAFFANAGTGGTTSLSSSSLTEGSDPNNRHFTPAGTITATNDSPTNGDA